MISTIAARRLISSHSVVEYPLVRIEDGRISQIESLNAADHERVQATYNFREATLVPAYVDLRSGFLTLIPIIDAQWDGHAEPEVG